MQWQTYDKCMEFSSSVPQPFLKKGEMLPPKNESSWTYVTQFVNRTAKILEKISFPSSILYQQSNCGLYFLTSHNSNIGTWRVSDVNNWSFEIYDQFLKSQWRFVEFLVSFRLTTTSLRRETFIIFFYQFLTLQQRRSFVEIGRICRSSFNQFSTSQRRHNYVEIRWRHDDEF